VITPDDCTLTFYLTKGGIVDHNRLKVEYFSHAINGLQLLTDVDMKGIDVQDRCRTGDSNSSTPDW